jgi:AbrB family looped-hinge helix DNA binding protein
MVNINITTLSSKGQVVIPLDMRQGISEGDKMIIIKNGDQIILKKADKFSKNIEEDLKFALKTEEAWKRYEEGEFVSRSKEDFILELSKI